MSTRDDQQLTPEFGAMMKRAAIEIAREQQYTPESEEALRGWLEANFSDVLKRAQEKMQRLTDWALENMDELAPIIGRRVYDQIQQRFAKGELTKGDNMNPRYSDWAASLGMTPLAAQQAHKTNAPYLTWNGDAGIAKQVIRTRPEWNRIAMDCRGKTRLRSADTMAQKFAQQDGMAGILEHNGKVTMYSASTVAKAGHRSRSHKTAHEATEFIKNAYRDLEALRAI